MKTTKNKFPTPTAHRPCSSCPTADSGFFCSFGDEISKTIDHIKIDLNFKAGQTIYAAGSSPEGLYCIREGAAKVELLTDHGSVNIINFVGEGGLLGYRSLFNNQPHSTSAIAVESCKISFLPGGQIKKLFECHKELTLKIISKLADDVRQAEQKWLNQINKTAQARIAEALLFLDEHFKDIYWTRKEIAEWAGTTPETVIRTLTAFESEGLIKKNAKNFSIERHAELVNKACL